MTGILHVAAAFALTSNLSVQDMKKDPPKDVANTIGMKFIWVSPGNFMMGSPEKEIERFPDERLHKVTLTKGFYMGKYPVTQEQWQAVMGNNPSEFLGEKKLPVERVSWDDCQEFLKKLRLRDKKAYRLPTEAEWEYCCRAGTTKPFYFGETISTDQANYNGNFTYRNGQPGLFRKKTTPVGMFPPNAWGFYDMHGNVSQWCQDWKGDYSHESVIDPQGPGGDNKFGRVLRGGSWANGPGHCRSASRNGGEPSARYGNWGVRVCFFEEVH